MIFDAHGDILTDVTIEKQKGVDIWDSYHEHRYQNAQVTGSIFVNFTDPNSQEQTVHFEQIHNTALDYFKSKDNINIINHNNWSDDKFNLIFGIEGLNAVNSVDQLEELYKMGYRHIGLTWNEKNKFATGANEQGGLTPAGEELIKKAESLKMIVDFAHLNEQSFWEAAKVVNRPIFVSHANVAGLVKHQRNLTDEQLEAIKKTNGVVGLTVMASFLNETCEEASITDFINHIHYIINLVGIDHVGFGFDFCHYLKSHDIENPVSGLSDIQDVPQIIKLLEKSGMNKVDIEKICYKNMVRVLNSHLNS